MRLWYDFCGSTSLQAYEYSIGRTTDVSLAKRGKMGPGSAFCKLTRSGIN